MSAMNQSEAIASARPAKYFALPPYRAELFDATSGWAGVINRSGFNCLTSTKKPHAVVTDIETATLIAEKWNQESRV